MPQLDVEYFCPHCGGSVADLPDEFTDDSTVSCGLCAAQLGRWGDLRALRGPLLSDRGAKSLADAVNSIPAIE